MRSPFFILMSLAALAMLLVAITACQSAPALSPASVPSPAPSPSLPAPPTPLPATPTAGPAAIARTGFNVSGWT